MARVLASEPYLAQMALRRQPWNAEERAAGGIVEQHPEDFYDRWTGQHEWLEHRRFFTTNPCLYRRQLLEHGWPEGTESEGHFSIQLRDLGYSFGYWGARDSGNG